MFDLGCIGWTFVGEKGMARNEDQWGRFGLVKSAYKFDKPDGLDDTCTDEHDQTPKPDDEPTSVKKCSNCSLFFWFGE